MPITQSARKALRQSVRRKKRNTLKKENVKNSLKEIKKLLAAKKKNEAEKLVSSAYKALDKAAKAGVIKKNTANRKKSRLMKLFRSAE